MHTTPTPTTPTDRAAPTPPTSTSASPSTSAAPPTSAASFVEVGAAPRRSASRWQRWVLGVDAAGCAVIGVGVLAAAVPLATGFALAGPGAVLLAGSLFLVAAGVNAHAAHRMGDGQRWSTLVAIDLDVVFALWMALTLATGRGEPWVRGLAAAGLGVSIVMAGLKAVGLRRSRG